MTIEMNLEDNLEMEVEDILSGITADLVEFKSNSPFLDRLFSEKVGQWIEVESLCSGLKEIENQFEELRKLFDVTLRVTWLDYPNAAIGKGYCTIVFFVEALHWSNLALYNKQLFLKNIVLETPIIERRQSERLPAGQKKDG